VKINKENVFEKRAKELMNIGTITLSFEEREKLSKEPKCPRCECEEFKLTLAERTTSKKHPFPSIQIGRPIIQCSKCGYWTDWFDGYVWHPKEELRK